MRRSTILLSTAAVLVLSAGLVVGRLSSRIPHRALQLDHDHSWFQEQLGLTADQRQHMDSIWADARQQMDKLGEHRHGMEHDRDAAIKALLTPEQSTAYDKIIQDYHTHRADLDKEREALFHGANDRSRALLTPDQQTKWDAMSKQMHEHHGPPGMSDHGHGGPDTRPNGGPPSP